MWPQISMQRSTNYGMLQALLGTEDDEVVLSQASCRFALLRTSLALGLELRAPILCASQKLSCGYMPEACI